MIKTSYVHQIELDICRHILGLNSLSNLVSPQGMNSWVYNGKTEELIIPTNYANPCLEVFLDPIADCFMFKLKPLSEFMDYITNNKIGKLKYPKIAIPIIADSNPLVAKDKEIRNKLVGDLI